MILHHNRNSFYVKIYFISVKSTYCNKSCHSHQINHYDFPHKARSLCDYPKTWFRHAQKKPEK